MVVDYGMSDRIGNVSFNLSGNNDSPVFVKPYSDHTARMNDEEVKLIIDEVRQRERELNEQKRDLLNDMASALLKKQVLRPRERVEILGTRPYSEYEDIHGNGEW